MSHNFKIDEEILPLIEAMNNTGFIETFSSCEGHPDSEHSKRPYVAFFCKSDNIPSICNILNDIEGGAEDYAVAFDLGIIHEPLLIESQLDTEKGLLALHLRIMARRAADKRHAFKLLTDRFIELKGAEA